ncbi:diphosphate-dependent phosphofructokinase [Pillotina sp. SPG140]|jgi:pyrophosphate--fructose-6-phosphate 1-phosphotransferase
MEVSPLQKARYAYTPKVPRLFLDDVKNIALVLGEPTESISEQETLKSLFKYTYGKPIATFKQGRSEHTQRTLTVGVILSGGQAPGGHNVIAGLYDGLKKGNVDSKLYGFVGGPLGLIENHTLLLNDTLIDTYRNTGGFDMIGSGRTKIESPEQCALSLETVQALGLDAILIIGGDDSNTNAALLAEYFIEHGSACQVIGCPKTIDGDLKNESIEVSFGFDTAVKTYSELIGNICRDANSARKYWHFIKLMGRSASHITLECALQTHPNVCLISEEIAEHKWSLNRIVSSICDSIIKRAEKKQYYGVVLVPEGLIEFIPEMRQLIVELNDILALHTDELAQKESLNEHLAFLYKKLSQESAQTLASLPQEIAEEFLMDRDPHGNVQVSRIETEKLLITLVERRLAEYEREGTYRGKFSALRHFFGYEGRCAFPSNFDADYCYSLGLTAFLLINCGLTGYLASVKNLVLPPFQWIPLGVPLTVMMHTEQRRGTKKPVIRKALVDLAGAPFKEFTAHRDAWAVSSEYLVPGPVQYFGPAEVCDQPNKTLQLEHVK